MPLIAHRTNDDFWDNPANTEQFQRFLTVRDLLFFDIAVVGDDLTTFKETVRGHVMAQVHFAGQRILRQSFSG